MNSPRQHSFVLTLKDKDVLANLHRVLESCGVREVQVDDTPLVTRCRCEVIRFNGHEHLHEHLIEVPCSFDMVFPETSSRPRRQIPIIYGSRAVRHTGEGFIEEDSVRVLEDDIAEAIRFGSAADGSLLLPRGLAMGENVSTATSAPADQTQSSVLRGPEQRAVIDIRRAQFMASLPVEPDGIRENSSPPIWLRESEPIREDDHEVRRRRKIPAICIKDDDVRTEPVFVGRWEDGTQVRTVSGSDQSGRDGFPSRGVGTTLSGGRFQE